VSPQDEKVDYPARYRALDDAATKLGYDCNCRRAQQSDCRTVGCGAAQCIAHERTMLRAVEGW
jgi:hypothetical protein